MVRQMSKESCFIAPSNCKHVEGSQTLVKPPWEYFYQIILSLWGKLTCKTSLLVIFELLQLFVKTLIVDGKDSLCNIQNLPKLVQMELSRKINIFCQFFSLFLKYASNF